MIVCLDGKYVDETAARVSVFDNGFLYGDGVYETMRTYGGRLWHVDQHMARLEHSLKVAGIRLPFAVGRLVDMIRMTIRKNKLVEARVRVMVTRGMNSAKGARFGEAKSARATVCILVFPLALFDGRGGALSGRGAREKLPAVKAVFFPLERAFPTVKSLSLFPLIMARKAAGEAHAFDALLVDRNGYAGEGAISNLFIVKRGILYTPRRGVLFGIARDAVLRAARRLVREKKIKKIRYSFFKRGTVLRADEVFLTNAPTGIASVIKIGDRKIANGKPGPITKLLHKRFLERVT